MSGQSPARPGYPTPPPPDHPVPSQTSVRTQIFIALAIGALFALFVYVARAPASRALGSGLVIAVVSIPLLRAMDLIRIEWPTAPDGRAVRVAGIPRWRLNGFDALTDHRPGLSPDLRFRLRGLATGILARRGLTPDSPDASEVLGAATHELLFRPDRVGTDPPPPGPDAAQITALIDRLIELGDPRGQPGTGLSRVTALSEQIIEMEGNR